MSIDQPDAGPFKGALTACRLSFVFAAILSAIVNVLALVAPVYTAYLAILGQHGETPDPEALTVEERTVLEHWQMAEAAALEAVFGPHRHLDEGGYDIVLPA